VCLADRFENGAHKILVLIKAKDFIFLHNFYQIFAILGKNFEEKYSL